MKHLKTYSKEQFHNSILEKLKVSKNNYDPILDIVPDEWYDQPGRIFLHFNNISSNHGISFHFFESSLISLMNVLCSQHVSLSAPWSPLLLGI